jgi:hypothetical protein
MKLSALQTDRLFNLTWSSIILMLCKLLAGKPAICPSQFLGGQMRFALEALKGIRLWVAERIFSPISP